jgi:pimeloyl-ACP methyl ester carboxylesterase
VRRWLRRTGLVLLVLVVTAGTGSQAYNVLTSQRAAPPSGLTFVRTGDVLTRYREWGSAASGPPIVLVHGAAESADTWAPLAPLLATRHRVIALDLDGWGYPDRVAPFDLDHQTRQLLGLIAALRLDRPILVGHSSGAAIVAEAALRAPRSVGGLMFLDGDALSTGAGERSPVRFLLLPPFRTTLLRLAVRSDALIRSVYGRACGPRCPALEATGVERWRRPFQVAGAESAVWEMASLGVPGLPVPRLRQLRDAPFPRAVV